MTKNRVILIAAIAIAVLVIAGVSGQITPTIADDCVQTCNAQYKACSRAEDARHKAAMNACGSDQVCRKAEIALHQQLSQNCTDAAQLCKQACP